MRWRRSVGDQTSADGTHDRKRHPHGMRSFAVAQPRIYAGKLVRSVSHYWACEGDVAAAAAGGAITGSVLGLIQQFRTRLSSVSWALVSLRSMSPRRTTQRNAVWTCPAGQPKRS